MKKSIKYLLLFVVFFQGCDSQKSKVNEAIVNDVPSEYRLLAKEAIKGNSEAQFQLGVVYFDGDRIQKDDNKALFWFEKAAKNGYQKAYFNTALLYQMSSVDKRNYNEALRWYENLTEMEKGQRIA